VTKLQKIECDQVCKKGLTHARVHARTHARTHTHSAFGGFVKVDKWDACGRPLFKNSVTNIKFVHTCEITV